MGVLMGNPTAKEAGSYSRETDGEGQNSVHTILSTSGSSGPSVRPHCKGPLRESGLHERYSESRCASMGNCRLDPLYQGRSYYSSLPSLPLRRKSSSGSSEPSVRTQCKGPLQEPGLQGGYNESVCASMDNCCPARTCPVSGFASTRDLAALYMHLESHVHGTIAKSHSL